MRLPGIFCLEGEWDHDLTDRKSVVHHLRTIENLGQCRGLIHRDVGTREEFDYYIGKWKQKKYADYKLAYLAFHGDRSCINIGRAQLSLTEMAETLRGAMVGRTIYFGSCRTMLADDDELVEFCKITGSKAVVGYTKEIDWLESAAFDFILLPELLRRPYAKSTYTRLEKDHPRFVKGLGLRIATRSWCSPASVARAAATVT